MFLGSTKVTSLNPHVRIDWRKAESFVEVLHLYYGLHTHWPHGNFKAFLLTQNLMLSQETERVQKARFTAVILLLSSTKGACFREKKGFIYTSISSPPPTPPIPVPFPPKTHKKTCRINYTFFMFSPLKEFSFR